MVAVFSRHPGCLAADTSISPSSAVADTRPVRVTVVIHGNEHLALSIGAVDARWSWGSELLRIVLVQCDLVGWNDLLDVVLVQRSTAPRWKAVRIAPDQYHALKEAGATHGTRCAHFDTVSDQYGAATAHPLVKNFLRLGVFSELQAQLLVGEEQH